MMNKLNQKKFFAPADVILIGVLVILCLLFILFRQYKQPDSLQVIIEKDGSVLSTYALADIAEPVIISVDDTAVKVQIDADGASIISSDCPDQTCVHTGLLDHSGDAAVCLPNRVVVRLVGSSAPAVDGITG